VEVEAHIITGLVSAAKNIYRCVEKAGYQVADVVLEPLASSFAVLEDEEKEAGVVLIDIGGGTTDIAIFQEDTIRHTAVVAIAGNKVTDDIRIGLNVLEDQAMRLKHEHGVAFTEILEEDEILTVPGIAGRPPKEIKKSILTQIIEARVEEILEISAQEIKRSGYSNELSAGVVFTGGGSLLNGICPLANEVLGMDAKIGVPRGITGGLIDQVNNPIFATGVGLVIHALKTQQANQQKDAMLPSSSKGTGVEKVLNRMADAMKRWFDEL